MRWRERIVENKTVIPPFDKAALTGYIRQYPEPTSNPTTVYDQYESNYLM
ncbi:hypothetical protein QUF90_12555 [Desulfococcaceae bacterium HSG9]|nr:hypothetical protein [Desulfococcaceae bacterium HSG9]